MSDRRPRDPGRTGGWPWWHLRGLLTAAGRPLRGPTRPWAAPATAEAPRDRRRGRAGRGDARVAARRWPRARRRRRRGPARAAGARPGGRRHADRGHRARRRGRRAAAARSRPTDRLGLDVRPQPGQYPVRTAVVDADGVGSGPSAPRSAPGPTLDSRPPVGRAAGGRDGRRRDAGDRHLRRRRSPTRRVREAHDRDEPRRRRGLVALDPPRLHWRPADYWKAGTDVTVDVDVNSVPAGDGVYGQESRRRRRSTSATP